jgi:hypothetical protein
MGYARGLRRGSVTVKIPPSRGRNNARPVGRFLTPAPPARPPSRNDRLAAAFREK